MSKRAYQLQYDSYLKSNTEIPYNVFVRRLTDKKRYWENKLKPKDEIKSERIVRIQKRLEVFSKKKDNGLDCKFEVRPVPEIEPTTLLGKIRKFFLSFKS